MKYCLFVCSLGKSNLHVINFTGTFLSKDCNISHPARLIRCMNKKQSLLTIEGFGGKRAVGFLLKIELCRKRSKFRMQFCLGALNNVLYVFLLKFSSFTRY